MEQLEETFFAVSDPDHPEYRNFMSIEDITNMIAPPKEDRKTVKRWLLANGVDKKSIIDNGDSFEVTTTVEVASRLFYTKFKTFRHKESGISSFWSSSFYFPFYHILAYMIGKQQVRQFGDFSIPSHLENLIDLVLGLSEFPPRGYALKKTPMKAGNASSPNILVSIAPQSIQTIYRVGSATVKNSGTYIFFQIVHPMNLNRISGASVGVAEFEQQYFAPSDLANFAQSFNVPITPIASSRIIGFNDPTNPQLEATLDIQYVLGRCSLRCLFSALN